jgi:hypothetical protein
MPIDYRIHFDRRRVVATASGILTDADVFGYQREVWSRDDVAGFDEIVDMTAVDNVELPVPSSERMRTLAAESAERDVPAASRFAIVAPGDLAYGLGRMYAVYRETDRRSTKEVRVFRRMDEALSWLEEGKRAE